MQANGMFCLTSGYIVAFIAHGREVRISFIRRRIAMISGGEVMKRMGNLMRVVLCVGLMAVSLLPCAQNVYVTRGAHGPVFSDKPQPGAKEMQLPPLSVIPAQKLPQKQKASSGAAGDMLNDVAKGRVESKTPPQTPYGTFTILFPEQNGSVVANTGSFMVRLAVEPPLRLGEGHAFTISFNGQPVGQRFTANEFMFPPEFWGGSMPPINQRAQLDASIVDSAGRVIMNASPAVFFMRYTTVLQRPHWRPPLWGLPSSPPRYVPPQLHRMPPRASVPEYIPPWKPAYPRELFPGSHSIEMPLGERSQTPADSENRRSGYRGHSAFQGDSAQTDAQVQPGASSFSGVRR